MALDGKLLALARKQLEDIRHHNEDAQAAHRQEVYARLPRVQQIDTALRGQMRELAGLTLWGGPGQAGGGKSAASAGTPDLNHGRGLSGRLYRRPVQLPRLPGHRVYGRQDVQLPASDL